MTMPEGLQTSLSRAWHKDIAYSSMDRWLSLSKKNNWRGCPENLELLAALFGASWYFTRFVFFRGSKIAGIFDDPRTLDFTSAALIDEFMDVAAGDDPGIRLEALKIAKNEIMLTILLAQIMKQNTQEEVEFALSNLAEATLFCAIKILAEDDAEVKNNVAIFAMGRLAGYEMNFGSDLDLIFIYHGGSQELAHKISSFVRKLMRNIGILSPAGLLYEVDMRLRPHGNSGVLVTGERSFVDYHNGEREIWERQMMTRCRAVIDVGGCADLTLAKIQPSIYQKYDNAYLKSEILKTRKLVVNELCIQKGKYDLKRDAGGVMDIDFLTNYLQLLYGGEDKTLHTASTRQALRNLTEARKINKETSKFLLESYDYLKSMESHLRVFDMKSTSIFSKDLNKIEGLVRSMGYLNNNYHSAEKSFIDDYKSITQRIRRIFKDILYLV